MNDFSKQELERILEGLDKLPRNWNGWEKRWRSDLEVKIQNMIDNYCEHESDGFIYTNSDISNDCPYKCHKCGDFFK